MKPDRDAPPEEVLALAAVRVAAGRWLPIKARAAPRERRAVYLSGLQKIPRLRMYRQIRHRFVRFQIIS